jgi:general stress protein YciG
MARDSKDTGASTRGFTSMDPHRQREIASKVGQASRNSTEPRWRRALNAWR